MREFDGQGCAKVGYGLCALLLIHAIMSQGDPDTHVRVCQGREGVKVADYIPGGKRRHSRNVTTKSGELIPYGEWVRSCRAIHLPGAESGE